MILHAIQYNGGTTNHTMVDGISQVRKFDWELDDKGKPVIIGTVPDTVFGAEPKKGATKAPVMVFCHMRDNSRERSFGFKGIDVEAYLLNNNGKTLRKLY